MSRFSAFVVGVAVIGAAAAVLPAVPAVAAAGSGTVTITADYQQKYYADATPRFTWTVTGLAKGERLRTRPTCSVAGAHRSVGRYVIRCRGAKAPGHRIRYVAQRYLVAPSPVLVGPYDQYAIYGSEDPAFTWAAFGLRRGEHLATAPRCTVAGAHAHAGTYRIACHGATVTRDYTLRVVPGRLVVIKAVSIMKAETFLPGGVVTATLAAAKPDLQRLAGQPVTFTAGTTTLCTATTDDQGVATCSPGANTAALLGAGSYTAHYAGTRDIRPTTASATTS